MIVWHCQVWTWTPSTRSARCLQSTGSSLVISIDPMTSWMRLRKRWEAWIQLWNVTKWTSLTNQSWLRSASASTRTWSQWVVTMLTEEFMDAVPNMASSTIQKQQRQSGPPQVSQKVKSAALKDLLKLSIRLDQVVIFALDFFRNRLGYCHWPASHRRCRLHSLQILQESSTEQGLRISIEGNHCQKQLQALDASTA